jgi:hypothetical protein
MTPASQPTQIAANPLPAPAPTAITQAAPPAPIANVIPPALEQKNQSLPELTLNGLFFSNNQGYVLINNQILKEGDEINGVIVKRITLDGVELDAQGSIIKLPNK